MAESNGAAAPKSKTEYTEVEMTDGRKVTFAGKRKVNKSIVIDESKVEVADGLVQLSAGAISIRMDFRNGETRLMPLPLSLLAKFAGHGAEQKYGDELAAPSDKPLSEDDMVVAIDDLNAEIQAGNWGKGRAEGGGGVAGASLVIKALVEATGKDMGAVKKFINDMLEQSKQRDGDKALTRRAVYDSFRVNAKVGPIIKRMEEEKAAGKQPKIDTEAALAGLAGA